ncbi:MAG: protein kinase domain-containing protein [Gallintestinimicrobium sp.]
MAYITSWYWNKGDFRKVNEDSFTCSEFKTQKEFIFAAVCDERRTAAGECASGLVEQLRNGFTGKVFGKCASFLDKTDEKVAPTRFDMQKAERCEREENCSGTTVTMVFVRGRRFVLVHLGDSRAYQLCRKRCLNREKQTGTRQLSQDHEEGGVLRRCVGAFGLEVPQLYTGTLDDGDMLLLCTDGFYKKAPPDFFRICLYEEREAGQLYRRLKGIGSFLTAQGEKDNMTAVLIGYEKDESVWKKNEKIQKIHFKRRNSERGTGTVYRARSALQKIWAAKKVGRDFPIREEFTMGKLADSAFPGIVDVVEQEEERFLIMEWIEGETLAAQMERDGAFAEETVIEIGICLAKAIQKLHQMQPPLLYLDCKPSNVMKDSDGKIRLIDFGSALEAHTPVTKGISASPGYAAPEQLSREIEKRCVDVRTDVFGLGRTLYALCAGQFSRPPYAFAPESRVRRLAMSWNRLSCVPQPGSRKHGFRRWRLFCRCFWRCRRLAR